MFKLAYSCIFIGPSVSNGGDDVDLNRINTFLS